MIKAGFHRDRFSSHDGKIGAPNVKDSGTGRITERSRYADEKFL